MDKTKKTTSKKERGKEGRRRKKCVSGKYTERGARKISVKKQRTRENNEGKNHQRMAKKGSKESANPQP